MQLILNQLLEQSAEELLNYPIPFETAGFKRLRSILYHAKWHLRHREATLIEQACIDLHTIYHTFYDDKKTKLANTLLSRIDESDLNLKHHINVERYVTDEIDALKLLYPGYFDVICAIISDCAYGVELRSLPKVETNFSNLEFFCVLALYKGACALSKLNNYYNTRMSGEHDDRFPMMLPLDLNSAMNSLMQAQLAIHEAELLSLKTDYAILNAKDWQSIARQEMAKQAMNAKFGADHKLRIEKAIELYKNGNFHSRLQAANALVEPIQQFSEEHNITPLKPDNAWNTIYKWLTKHDKERLG